MIQVYKDLSPFLIDKVPTHEDWRTGLVEGKCITNQTSWVHCDFSQQQSFPVEVHSPPYLVATLPSRGRRDVVGSKSTAQLTGCFAKPAQRSEQRHNSDKTEVRVTESLHYQRCGSQWSHNNIYTEFLEHNLWRDKAIFWLNLGWKLLWWVSLLRPQDQ